MNGLSEWIGRASVVGVGIVILAIAVEPSAATAQGGTIVVDQGGSGDYAAIGDALMGATAGDTILVRAGKYVETITIDKEVTIVGNGRPNEVVIVAPDAEPVILIDGADAVISGMTVQGDESVVLVSGGDPILRNIIFDGVGSIFTPDESCHALFGPGGCNAVALRLDGGRARVTDNEFAGGGQIRVVGGSSPVIEGNRLTGGAHVFLEEFGDATVVRGNSIIDADHAAIAIYTTGRPTIEGNLISGSGTSGIEVGLQLAPGIEPVIRGNIIRGGQTGIEVASGAVPVIEDNDITGTALAIVIAGSDATVLGNELRDNASGIFVLQGSPVIEANTISGGRVGIGLGSDRATPFLIGNSICGNGTNINLSFGAEMPAITGNDICSDGEP